MNLTVDGVDTFVHGLAELEPARTPVVLVHGAGCDHSLWRYQTRRLIAAGVSALAPDLPGHGRSGGEALGTIDQMGEWLQSLLGTLDVQRPVLVGHSMGSLVALRSATQMETAGLVLIGTADRMTVHPELLEAAASESHLAVDLIVGWSLIGDQRLGGHPNPGTWTRAGITRLFERNLARLHTDLAACNDHDPVTDAAGVHCPALVINGTADLMTPYRAARRLAAAIAGSEVIAVEGGSHMALYENPRAITKPLLHWIGQLTGRSAERDPAG